jgi:DNA replication protein DnaC
LEEEMAARHERYLKARTRLSNLPFQKTLAEFDFAAQPSIDERQVRDLATLRFVADGQRMRVYLTPKLLVIDEMGYLPFGQMETQVFFQLVSKRYERGASLILTSNKSYGEWGSIFGDPIIAGAILDRLLHRSTTVNIRGESYRLREKRKAGILAPSREVMPAK